MDLPPHHEPLLCGNDGDGRRRAPREAHSISRDRAHRQLCPDRRKRLETFPGLESDLAFGKKDNLVSWWLRHGRRRERERIGFYTSEEEARRHPRDLNIFGGLPYDFLDVPDELDMGLLQPLLDHCRDCLANGDAAHYEYQLDWFAACLQKREKIGVILIFMGKQHSRRALRP